MALSQANTVSLKDLERAVRRIRTYAPQYFQSHAPKIQVLIDTLQGMNPPRGFYYPHELQEDEVALINWALHQIGV